MTPPDAPPVTAGRGRPCRTVSVSVRGAKSCAATGTSRIVSAAGALAMRALSIFIGPGKVIVTCLCDPGSRYASKLFNPEFLRSKGLPTPDWM